MCVAAVQLLRLTLNNHCTLASAGKARYIAASGLLGCIGHVLSCWWAATSSRQMCRWRSDLHGGSSSRRCSRTMHSCAACTSTWRASWRCCRWSLHVRSLSLRLLCQRCSSSVLMLAECRPAALWCVGLSSLLSFSCNASSARSCHVQHTCSQANRAPSSRPAMSTMDAWPTQQITWAWWRPY